VKTKVSHGVFAFASSHSPLLVRRGKPKQETRAVPVSSRTRCGFQKNAPGQK
jgi:hypothetical protein